MEYAVIAENDTSKWNDETGLKYHFPAKYIKLLQPGTKVIYYKGKMKESRFRNFRLSIYPHYFGIAKIEAVTKDSESDKNNYYAEIGNFIKFPKSVHFKQNDNPLEEIPTNKTTNYYRTGVRKISGQVFNKIVSLAEISEMSSSTEYNDEELYNIGLNSNNLEGAVWQRYTTVYERNQALREQAINIHGYNCMACNLNFKEFYGDWGEGFIHVHHLQPVSSFKEKHIVNPKTDLVVLCANCHSMVHRKKTMTLSLEELKMKIVKKVGL